MKEYLDDVISILKLLRNKNFSAEEEYKIILEWFYDSNDKFDKNDNIFLMFAFNTLKTMTKLLN